MYHAHCQVLCHLIHIVAFSPAKSISRDSHVCMCVYVCAHMYYLFSEVTSDTDFHWLCQLRYYWEKDDCIARITNATVSYQYEYLGNTGRLALPLSPPFIISYIPSSPLPLSSILYSLSFLSPSPSLTRIYTCTCM